jgi:hypothetical protein
MTISAYHVDNVIKAYNKQSRLKVRLDAGPVASQDNYRDVVTLSGGNGLTTDAYKRISYNLVDALLKDKTSAP